jgi:DNA polymerase (family 10)
VHSYFELPEAAQTERMLRAIGHPSVDAIAHPFGRQIGHRAPMALDLDALAKGAAEQGVWLEVNAQPERLDLDDVACRRAIQLGVTILIDTDAHSAAEFQFMRWGVGQARRGWATNANVANTWPLERLLRSLRRAR